LKFSLISASPNAGLDERENKKSIAAWPPLSLLYLASVLEEADVEVSVLDQPGLGLTVEETVKWVKREKPDVLGFSTLASSGRTAALISEKVKEENPDITTIFGNHYATFNPERILRKYASVDIIVRGEGEHTVVQLVNALKKGDDLKKVRGINFRSKSGITGTPDQPLIEEINSLPFPRREMISVDYHCMMAGVNVAPKKFTAFVSSRGCVYRCRFCSCTQIARKAWRPRSAKNAIEELQLLANEGYKQLIFVDDSFTLNPKRVIELCRGMRREKLDFEWICEGRVDNCTYEVLREMVKAGCKILYFGIESANQRILDYYNKKITVEQAETAVRTAKKTGVDAIVGSFILGAPDETREEIQNTINFARRVPIDIPQFNILGAHPGNEIWKEMQAKGLLETEKYWETGIGVSEICPTAVPGNEIKRMVHKAFFQFIKRPNYLVRQLAKTLSSNYRLNVIVNNIARVSDIYEGTSSVT
jgi:anaerobic magnesium-protoporphyrin IX monomethyl ester cyclase